MHQFLKSVREDPFMAGLASIVAFFCSGMGFLLAMGIEKKLSVNSISWSQALFPLMALIYANFYFGNFVSIIYNMDPTKPTVYTGSLWKAAFSFLKTLPFIHFVEWLDGKYDTMPMAWKWLLMMQQGFIIGATCIHMFRVLVTGKSDEPSHPVFCFLRMARLLAQAVCNMVVLYHVHDGMGEVEYRKASEAIGLYFVASCALYIVLVPDMLYTCAKQGHDAFESVFYTFALKIWNVVLTISLGALMVWKKYEAFGVNLPDAVLTISDTIAFFSCCLLAFGVSVPLYRYLCGPAPEKVDTSDDEEWIDEQMGDNPMAPGVVDPPLEVDTGKVKTQ